MAAQASLPLEFSRFSPVIGNDILPHHPFYPTAPLESVDIPVIISTTLDDAAISLANFDLTESELKQNLEKQFEGNASAYLQALSGRLSRYIALFNSGSPHYG